MFRGVDVLAAFRCACSVEEAGLRKLTRNRRLAPHRTRSIGPGRAVSSYVACTRAEMSTSLPFQT